MDSNILITICARGGSKGIPKKNICILFIYLLILFIAIPVLEIIIFIEIGSFVGTFNTILLTFLTAIVGVYLVRQQGLSTIQKIMVQLQSGERPVVTMFEGLVILVAGVLLLTPGFFTDTIGFLGLIPVTRTLMIRLVQTTMMKRYNVHQDDTIEGEYIDLDHDGDQKN